jgi:hypothetical protein
VVQSDCVAFGAGDRNKGGKSLAREEPRRRSNLLVSQIY